MSRSPTETLRRLKQRKRDWIVAKKRKKEEGRDTMKFKVPEGWPNPGAQH